MQLLVPDAQAQRWPQNELKQQMHVALVVVQLKYKGLNVLTIPELELQTAIQQFGRKLKVLQ